MFLAVAADKIVAQPGTITGSIGVVTGKLNVRPLLQEIGVNTDSVKVGRNMDMLSPFTDIRPEQVRQSQTCLSPPDRAPHSASERIKLSTHPRPFPNWRSSFPPSISFFTLPSVLKTVPRLTKFLPCP